MSGYNMVEKLLERNCVFTLNLIFVSPVISMGIKAHVTLIGMNWFQWFKVEIILIDLM